MFVRDYYFDIAMFQDQINLREIRVWDNSENYDALLDLLCHDPWSEVKPEAKRKGERLAHEILSRPSSDWARSPARRYTINKRINLESPYIAASYNNPKELDLFFFVSLLYISLFACLLN